MSHCFDRRSAVKKESIEKRVHTNLQICMCKFEEKPKRVHFSGARIEKLENESCKVFSYNLNK